MVRASFTSKTDESEPTLPVDWSRRDQQYTRDIQLLYQQLLKEEKPVQITVSKICKGLGILANLERHLDKLPRTKQLLDKITETTQQFQLRRCYKVIDSLLENNEPIILWQIQRVAEIKSHHFHEIKPLLESYLKMKWEVKEVERTTS